MYRDGADDITGCIEMELIILQDVCYRDGADNISGCIEMEMIIFQDV